MTESDILKDLSKKAIHLSGNDLVNKKLSGNGAGSVFNVCDEIPQFVLDHLMGGKKFKVCGMQADANFLKDEKDRNFIKAYKEKLTTLSFIEKELEDEEVREIKDVVRQELGLPSTEELIPNSKVDLPWEELSDFAKHSDNILQTDIPEENLSKVLSKIEKERVRFLREKGLKVLYAAFGFLEWERALHANNDRKTYNSPLLLMEVLIETSNKSFRVVGNGDLFQNPELTHALENQLGRAMPNLTDFINDRSAFRLNQYLLAVKEYFQEFEECKVRNRIAIGVFKSRGIPVGEILPEGYSSEKIKKVETLLTASTAINSSTSHFDLDDPSTQISTPCFALPLDSSQHSTIMEVLDGKNVVIEGPPGTGKSQTIVNLIVSAIAQGKSVLFLAQKLAALEVVQNRLVECGMGAKCVPIHSEHTNKSSFYSSLKEKLEHTVEKGQDFESLLAERDKIVKELNQHAKLLGGGMPGTQKGEKLTIQRILTTSSVLQQRLGEQDRGIRFNLPDAYSGKNLENDLNHINELEDRVKELDSDSSLRFIQYFRVSEVLDPFQLDELFARILNLNEKLSFTFQPREGVSFSNLNEVQKSTNALSKAKEVYESVQSELNHVFGSISDTELEQFSEHAKRLGPAKNFIKKFLVIKLSWSKSHKAWQWLLDFWSRDPSVDSFETVVTSTSNLLDFVKKYEQNQKFLLANESLNTDLSEINKKLEESNDRLELFNEAVSLLNELKFIGPIESTDDLSRGLEMLDLSKSNFVKVCSVNHGLDDFEKKHSSSEWIRKKIISGTSFSVDYEAIIFNSLAKEISSRHKRIFRTDSKKLISLRQKFKQKEEALSKEYCKKIASVRPDPESVPTVESAKVREKEGFALVKHVTMKPTARVTVRELCSRAADALQSYIPCFLMTPSSVADFLPKNVEFDLLIIDEASQMLPEEAVGSMLRCNQVIVVGDQQQMPPTTFASSTLKEKEEDEERIESILDRALLSFDQISRLTFHYRSADESLINFSNQQFYQGSLVIPPSHGNDPELGLNFVDAGGVYYPNKGSNPTKHPNPVESEKIVQLILEEMRERPQNSLGVAVMNVKQSQRIEELFEGQKDKTIKNYLIKWENTPEYFFIKNLENVQGDERDTMIIGTVYGKDETGKLAQNFGPINQPKGENRVNVLITRAKKRVVVCSSIDPVDLSNLSVGTQVIRGYLDYAKNGNLKMYENPSVMQIEKRLSESGWENWIYQRLKEDSFDVVQNVGTSDWKIALAIRDPVTSGYLCGVELDSDMKLNACARDREILNHSVLKAKGWKIIRVEPVDFFIDPEAEYQSLKSQILELTS